MSRRAARRAGSKTCSQGCSPAAPAASAPPAARPLPAPSLPRRLACFVYEGVLLFGVVMIAGWKVQLGVVAIVATTGDARGWQTPQGDRARGG